VSQEVILENQEGWNIYVVGGILNTILWKTFVLIRNK
jgi:hypothetical protein